LHKVESPFETYRTDVHRNDLDVAYSTRLSEAEVNLRTYRAETSTDRGDWGEYGREVGGEVDWNRNGWNGSARATRLDGALPGGSKYDLAEIAASVGKRTELAGNQVGVAIGAEGYWSSRIKPTLVLNASRNLDSLTAISIQILQAVNPHSPEQMYASYGANRFEEPLDPILDYNRSLPARGRQLAPTLMRSVQFEATRSLNMSKFSGALFAWNEVNSAAWQVEGDSIVAWQPIADRRLYGWRAGYEIRHSYWRGGFSAVGLIRDFSAGDPQVAEPPFRLTTEVGWHRFFYNDKLETDILLSSRYYSMFHSPAERPNEPLGGKLPVDLRFTGRISRFTLYYGIHNLNGVHYQLVPGYWAMHKEEYWGVDWLLFD